MHDRMHGLMHGAEACLGGRSERSLVPRVAQLSRVPLQEYVVCRSGSSRDRFLAPLNSGRVALLETSMRPS
eukprot:scaffold62248_cov63-Phaeocystis_antarctica.AAC.10